MKSAQKFTISALSVAIMATATTAYADPIASSNSSNTSGTASQVVITHNMWDNPARLVETDNQVSINDGGYGGIVFEALGQKLGAHVRPAGASQFPAQFGASQNPASTPAPQLDLFWGNELGFGDAGARGFSFANNNSNLPGAPNNPQFLGQNLFQTSSYDDGTDILEQSVNTFNQINNNTGFGSQFGALMNDGQLDVNGMFMLISAANGVEADGSFRREIDASGGSDHDGIEESEIDFLGATLATGPINPSNAFDETNLTGNAGAGTVAGQNANALGNLANNGYMEQSGFNTNAQGRYYLDESFYGIGNFGFVSQTTERTFRVSADFQDRDENGNILNDQGVRLASSREISTSTLTVGGGVGLVQNVENVTLRIEQNINVNLTSEDTTNRVDDHRFIDREDNSNNVTLPNGTTNSTDTSRLRINLPMQASLEAPFRENWLFRAGLAANLLQWTNTTTENTNYVVNSDGDGFEADVTTLTTDTNTVLVPTGVNTNFGLGYSPIDDFTLDLLFNTAFLTGTGNTGAGTAGAGGLADTAIGSELTATYRF